MGLVFFEIQYPVVRITEMIIRGNIQPIRKADLLLSSSNMNITIAIRVIMLNQTMPQAKSLHRVPQNL